MHRRTRRRSSRALEKILFGSVFFLVVTAAANPPTSQQPTPPGPPTQLPPQPATSPLDEPLAMIEAARQTYRQVQDYSCLVVKQERINGVLPPEQYIRMQFRERPFSVALRWEAPKNMVGQEAYYVAGRNDGKIRVRSSGILGAVGFVSIDPEDPRVRRNSRHSVTEAGIGNAIETCAKRWELERQLGVTQVRIADYVFMRRPCRRVETIHTANPGNRFICYRRVMYFDKEHHLPVRVELYDWPRQGGPAEGELLEVVNFVDIRLNVGIPGESFIR